MTDPRIAEVAAKLTKAQQEALLNMEQRFHVLRINGSPAALHALKRKGLSYGPFADRPTEDGLAVRAHLLRSEQERGE